MKNIILHNKKFEVSITNTEIAEIVETIANNINATKIKDPLFIAVMNGAFLFAADLDLLLSSERTLFSILLPSTSFNEDTSPKSISLANGVNCLSGT